MTNRTRSVVLVGSVTVFACVKIPDLGPIEGAAKEIKAGATAIGKGMEELKKLDPIALNKLLDENKDLRAAVEQAQSDLAKLGTKVGIVEVSPSSRVFFEVTGYSGQLRLDAWVNSPNNPFLTNKVLWNDTKRPTVDYGVAGRVIEEKANIAWCGATKCGGPKPLHDIAWVFGMPRFGQGCNEGRAEIDNAYRAQVESALSSFLAAPFARPSGDLAGPQAIDRRLLKEGRHTLMLRVTPEVLDSTGAWALEFKSYIKHMPDGTTEQIHAGRLDSQTSKFSLGKPMADAFAGSFDVAFVQEQPQPVAGAQQTGKSR